MDTPRGNLTKVYHYPPGKSTGAHFSFVTRESQARQREREKAQCLRGPHEYRAKRALRENNFPALGPPAVSFVTRISQNTYDGKRREHEKKRPGSSRAPLFIRIASRVTCREMAEGALSVLSTALFFPAAKLDWPSKTFR